MKRTHLFGAAMSALALSATAAQAEFPEKPIEVIIPYGAGGNTDTSGRIFINAMRKVMDADIVPINVDGAGGTIGMAQLAREANDGYKLAYSPVAPVTVQPNLRPVPYDNTSFEPVCMVADNPTAITVALDSPHQSIEDLIAASKDGKVVAVGGAPGSMPHITQAALAQAYDTRFIYLPAGGGGKAAKAVLSGEATFAADTSAMEKVHGLRTLAVASEERVADLPEVPTLKELGKDVVVTIWFGAFAPVGTPEDVLETLSAACGEAVKDEDFLAGMANANYVVSYKDRAEFKDYFDAQYAGAGTFLEVIGVKSK